jgi:hypothetical protein
MGAHTNLVHTSICTFGAKQTVFRFSDLRGEQKGKCKYLRIHCSQKVPLLGQASPIGEWKSCRVDGRRALKGLAIATGSKGAPQTVRLTGSDGPWRTVRGGGAAPAPESRFLQTPAIRHNLCVICKFLTNPADQACECI